MTKRSAENIETEVSTTKKVKKNEKSEPNLINGAKNSKQNEKFDKNNQNSTKSVNKEEKSDKEINKKPNKFEKKGSFKNGKPFTKNFQKKPDGKPVDWNEYKKKKKEVQVKRKENKNCYDVMVKAKKIGENLRRKTLRGGEEERKKLCNELHELLKEKGHYSKIVMTHDMARIIQGLLKFGSDDIKSEIVQELKGMIVEMLQSKYAKYCVKRMLKYGNTQTRSLIVDACYSHAVKLASHAVSAAIFDNAFTTWATPKQKHHLVQEFFGDMYKESKDDNVKHLRDVYAESKDMKIASLGATKANLQRILNKTLLDSHIVQTVLMQFLQECSNEDRTELISQISSHVVILSNSKEGARACMICIWHGTNKDRKVIVKALKEHAIALSKHEHGHCTIITVMDSLDDTKIVYKILLTEIISHAHELALDEWGRKVLLWLVAPGDTAHFHPTFINELNEGRENSACKKDVDLRRKELLTAVQDELLKEITNEPKKWIANNSIAMITLAILKAANGSELKETFDAVAKEIMDLNFKIKENETETCGIENSGMHMILKKLIKHEKSTTEPDRPQFGASIVENLNNEVIEKWLQLNRGCFLFVFILESDSDEVQSKLKELLKPYKKTIKQLTTSGAKILLKKL